MALLVLQHPRISLGNSGSPRVRRCSWAMSSVAAVLVTCRAGWAQGMTASTCHSPRAALQVWKGSRWSLVPQSGPVLLILLFSSYMQSHVETFTKHMRAFARDQCRGNPLRFPLGPLLQFLCGFFLVSVQRGAFSSCSQSITRLTESTVASVDRC